MTHLPKSELVGVLSPSSINTRDIGTKWYDIGAVLNANFFTYLGNGIVIAGNGAGRIYRSTNYGNRWTDTGSISAGNFLCATYLGNGIVIACDSIGHVWRNTNFGNNGTSGSPTGEWVDQGAIAGAITINTISYLGNGVVIFGTNDNHIFRHTDYGDTAVSIWSDLGPITASSINISVYLENGIALVHTSTRVWRSIDYGLTWVQLASNPIIAGNKFVYCGNGIVIATGGAATIEISRSNDYGLTWTALPDFGLVMRGCEYLGNGIVTVGASDGHIYRSIDYGLTFTDVATISANFIKKSVYMNNGVVLVSDSTGEFFRSEVSYKTDESQVNYPRIISGDLGPLGAGTRSIDTVVPGTNIYTNNDKTRTLVVSVGCTCNTPVGAGAAFDVQADATAIPSTLVSPTVGIATGLAAESNIFMTTGYVGPGLNYRVNQIGAGVVTLDKWFEMYI